jgi:hypothetical protein
MFADHVHAQLYGQVEAVQFAVLGVFLRGGPAFRCSGKEAVRALVRKSGTGAKFLEGIVGDTMRVEPSKRR